MGFNALQLGYGKNNLTEKPLEYYRSLYAAANPHTISNRLGIPYDLQSRKFTFSFASKTYTVTHPEFEVYASESEDNPFERNPKAQILLLRYLLYASVFVPNGEFRSYRELPSGELYYNVFYNRCIRRFIAAYAERMNELSQAAEAMGAFPISGGDMAFQLELFDSLYIRFILWEGDDVCPASGQILFSSNFTAAFSVYDLTEIVEIILGELKRHCATRHQR